MLKWTHEDYIRAELEGWLINHSSGVQPYPHITYTRFRCPFCSAADARAFVEKRAEEGSEFHQQALAYTIQERLRRS